MYLMKEGSSQQSLVKNRIKALKIAEMACEEDNENDST